MLNMGTIIGERYEVVGCIGSGGMADVYKAKDHKLNRFVAMKVLKPEFSADTNFIRKFQREAQAAAGLAHPNVVNVFDVGEDKGVNYIVMELVEGITLKDYISKKGKLTVKEATSIAIQVSMGLEAAHNRNIVHRDIKPQNIIISTDGKVKVTDFGIARVASSNTISTNAMGSVHYSSPEQVRGGYSDFKSDIYSLGITIYEMVTGRVPFDGDTTVAIAIKHLQDEMVPPSQYVAELPHSLEEIILKCTQKSPDRRYSTLAELINDLKHSLIDPNGNFVNLTPLSNHAQTIMITPDEMKQIQNSAYVQPSVFNDDEDEDDEDDDEIFEKPSKKRRRRHEEDDDDDDDEHGGINTKLEKAMTIGGLIIGGIIICILIYMIASAAGLIKGGSKKPMKPSVEQTQEKEEEKLEVPDIVGKSKDDAVKELNSKGLGLKKGGEEASDTVPEGMIARQDPKAGTKVEKNAKITYYISTGKSKDKEEVTIPTGLVGKSLSDVQAELQQLGLSKVKIEKTKSEDVAVGKVISLNPKEGASVSKDTEVTITVSIGSGDEMVSVPNVRGVKAADAQATLEKLGLIVTVEESYDEKAGVAEGEVYGQTPKAGNRVEPGTSVTIKVLNKKANAGGSGATQNGESVEDGQWATPEAVNIEKPSNYQGGQVRLRLVQNGDGNQSSGGKVILSDKVLQFSEKGSYNVGRIVGKEGVSNGTLYFDEMQSDGNYKVLYQYQLEFEEE